MTKKTLTNKDIYKKIGIGRFIVSSFFCVAVPLSIILVAFISPNMHTFDNKTNLICTIAVSAVLFFVFILYMGVIPVIKMRRTLKAISSNNYKIEEDVLIDKLVLNYGNEEDTFRGTMTFKHNKCTTRSRTLFNESKIGESFYVFKIEGSQFFFKKSKWELSSDMLMLLTREYENKEENEAEVFE